jgi:hypothetical protein
MKSMQAVASAIACSALILLTVAAVLFLKGKREDLWVAMLGTFWGFFLTQTGLVSVRRLGASGELVSPETGASS